VDDGAGPRHPPGAKLGVALQRCRLKSAIGRAFVPLRQASELKGLALPDVRIGAGRGAVRDRVRVGGAR
jgi:hypothetical protein